MITLEGNVRYKNWAFILKAAEKGENQLRFWIHHMNDNLHCLAYQMKYKHIKSRPVIAELFSNHLFLNRNKLLIEKHIFEIFMPELPQ